VWISFEMTFIAPTLVLDHSLLPHNRANCFIHKIRSNASGYNERPEIKGAVRCLILLTYCALIKSALKKLQNDSNSSNLKMESCNVLTFWNSLLTLRNWKTIYRSADDSINYIDDDVSHNLINQIFTEIEIESLWNICCARLKFGVIEDMELLQFSRSEAMNNWGIYWPEDMDYSPEACVIDITALSPYIMIQAARTTPQVMDVASAYQLLNPISGWNETASVPHSNIPIFGYEVATVDSAPPSTMFLTSPRGMNSIHRAMASPRSSRISPLGASDRGSPISSVAHGSSSSGVCGGPRSKPMKTLPSGVVAALTSFHRMLLLLILHCLSGRFGVGESVVDLKQSLVLLRNGMKDRAEARQILLKYLLKSTRTLPKAKLRLLRSMYQLVSRINPEKTVLDCSTEFWSARPDRKSHISIERVFVSLVEEGLHWVPAPVIDLVSADSSIMTKESAHPALVARLNACRSRRNQMFLPELIKCQIGLVDGIAPWLMLSHLNKHHLDFSDLISPAFEDLLIDLSKKNYNYKSAKNWPRVIITQCNDSSIFINRPVSELIVIDSTRCRISVAAIACEAYIKGCMNCEVTVGATVVRLDHSYDLQLNALVPSPPLISGDCRHCQLGFFSLFSKNIVQQLKSIGITYSQEAVERSCIKALLLSSHSHINNHKKKDHKIENDKDEEVIKTGGMCGYNLMVVEPNDTGTIKKSSAKIEPSNVIGDSSVRSESVSDDHDDMSDLPVIPGPYQKELFDNVNQKMKSLQLIAGALYAHKTETVELRKANEDKVISAVETLFLSWLNEEENGRKQLDEAYISDCLFNKRRLKERF